MMNMRNEYSKVLGKGMSWSEWVRDSRRMTWDTLYFHTEGDVQDVLERAGLHYQKVKTSRVIRKDGTGRVTERNYIRIYI